jgi:hypothetical protein
LLASARAAAPLAAFNSIRDLVPLEEPDEMRRSASGRGTFEKVPTYRTGSKPNKEADRATS